MERGFGNGTFPSSTFLSSPQLAANLTKTGGEHYAAAMVPLVAQYHDVRLGFIVILCNFADKINKGNSKSEKIKAIFATSVCEDCW